MKYRKFSTRNHPILRDIDIDFTINGNTVDTILIVGENACGKTILLNELFKLAQTNKINYKKPIESISAEIELNDQERKEFKTTASIMTIKNDSPSNQSMYCSKAYVFDGKESNDIYLNWKGGSYFESITSNENIDFTQILDLQNKYVKPVISQGLKDNVISISAEVSDIIFKNGEKTININQLSSGEKQIVYRGAFLQENKNSMKCANVLIDDPETSLSSKWQKNILKFYRNLFTDENGYTSQIFFATHSENILKSAFEEIKEKKKKGHPEDILIIALENKKGIISAKKIDTPFVLPSLTFAEVNYHVFDVISNDLHIALYGYLQNKKKLYTIKKCDNYIKSHSKYDATKHKKRDTYNTTTYETLPTYIRNAIDHPSPEKSYSEDELRSSIKLLIEIIKTL